VLHPSPIKNSERSSLGTFALQCLNKPPVSVLKYPFPEQVSVTEATSAATAKRLHEFPVAVALHWM